MVYDPIYGCVRGRLPQPNEPLIDPEVIKNLLLDTLKQSDRVDALQAIADESLPKPQETKRGKLHFLIGLQRSGKSTYANRWVASPPHRENNLIFPRVIVCADNIRLAVTGQRYNRHTEPTVFMVKQYMLESLLSRGHDCLCDGTHTTKTSIKRLLEIDINATWTLINTPVEICKKRANETGQSDLVPVLDRTNRQLQELLSQGIANVCEEIRQEIKARWPNVYNVAPLQ